MTPFIADKGVTHKDESRYKTIPLVDENYSIFAYNRVEALNAYIDGSISCHAWNKLYKRNCFETIRYPVSHVYEDIDTTYKVLDIADRIAIIDAPLVMHRKRPGSITEEYTLASAKDRDRAKSHVAAFVKQNTPAIFSEKQKQKVARAHLIGTLDTYLRIGKDAWQYRDTVLQVTKEVDLKQCDFKTQIKYFLFYHCPGLYITIYKLLRIIKKRIGMI